MIKSGPIYQTKLIGLDKFLKDFIKLYENNNFPSKILLSGLKGQGKSTLAYHFINYVLSKDENFKYDENSFEINKESHTFKTIINKSNDNLKVIDVNSDKRSIDINQIRELISNLNKSSFNTKPRFVLIDNIEFLNINSINALLKILEEPNQNIYFILINNNKKILPTLISRCINYKISLTNNESLTIANYLLNGKLHDCINEDLIHYYSTPGNIYNLFKFAEINHYNLADLNLKEFLKIMINDNHYKKNPSIKYLFFDLIDSYFRKMHKSFTLDFDNKYSYFLRRISDTKIYNLDEEILFNEFYEEILNG